MGPYPRRLIPSCDPRWTLRLEGTSHLPGLAAVSSKDLGLGPPLKHPSPSRPRESLPFGRSSLLLLLSPPTLFWVRREFWAPASQGLSARWLRGRSGFEAARRRRMNPNTRRAGPTKKPPGPAPTRRDAARGAPCGVAARRRCTVPARIAFLAAPCVASPRAGVAPEILGEPEPEDLLLRHALRCGVLEVHPSTTRPRPARLPCIAGSGPRRALCALAAQPERIQGGPAKACEPKHTESRANKEAARPRANPEGRRPRGALLRCGASPMHRPARIAFLAAPCIASPGAGVAREILRGPEPLPDPRGTPPSEAKLRKANHSRWIGSQLGMREPGLWIS